MANATETTKRAAVWNPPRLRQLFLRFGTGNDGPRAGRIDEIWEGGASNPVYNACRTSNYRMPRSGDVSHGICF